MLCSARQVQDRKVTMHGLDQDQAARPNRRTQRPQNVEIVFFRPVAQRGEDIQSHVEPGFPQRTTKIVLQVSEPLGSQIRPSALGLCY